MAIDRIGPVDPVSKFQNTQKTHKSEKKAEKDSISISDDAKTMSEIYRVTEQVMAEPDIRMDKVEEAKRKLEDPDYINDQVLESVADNILELFGLE